MYQMKGENKMVILSILMSLAISFLLTSCQVWLLCWLLPALGITAIGTFVIVFSWKLALAIWVVRWFLRSIVSAGSKGNKNDALSLVDTWRSRQSDRTN